MLKSLQNLDTNKMKQQLFGFFCAEKSNNLSKNFIVIDDSFNDYFDSISTDIAFIQECRYNRINEQYYAKWAGNYEEPIDRRFHLSVAISKDENISKSNNDLKADYTCIFVKYALKRNLHKNRFLK